jgi:L-lactate dehydrogenase complex protein LldE
VELGTVQLFVTCLVDSLFPDVGESVVKILERHGLTVEFPFDQTCCGQPAFNAGYAAEASQMARHTLDVLDPTDGPIVVPSGSCAQMIIDHTIGLVAGDTAYAAKAKRVAARTREFTSFLVDDLGLSDLGARCAPTKATYHPSCHGLRGLGVREQPKTLLDNIDGLETVELPDAETCCGFGGVFSVELPEVSAAMMKTKLDNVASTGASFLVGGDVGCLMHLGGGIRRRNEIVQPIHIAKLLAGDEP